MSVLSLSGCVSAVVAVASDAQFKVSGSVKDIEGKALHRAHVTVAIQGGDWKSEPVFTNRNGKFEVWVPFKKSRVAWLAVYKDGYARHRDSFTMTRAKNRHHAIKISKIQIANKQR